MRIALLLLLAAGMFAICKPRTIATSRKSYTELGKSPDSVMNAEKLGAMISSVRNGGLVFEQERGLR